uniref:Uncharacterized protein n=1 Tax=Oryza brachyantha TaxID=4533 RepID=J3LN11_ORYBR
PYLETVPKSQCSHHALPLHPCDAILSLHMYTLVLVHFTLRTIYPQANREEAVKKAAKGRDALWVAEIG